MAQVIGAGVFQKTQVVGLAYFEANPDGIERRDSSERNRRVLCYEAADLNEAVANASADGRYDGRVLEIEVRRAEQRLVRVDLRGRDRDLIAGGEPSLFYVRLAGCDIGLVRVQLRHRGVEILLGRGIGFHERREPVDILLSFEFVGFGLRQVRLGLKQRHLLLRELGIGFALRYIALGFGDIGLVGAEIENVQDIARFDVGSGPEQSLTNVAVDLSANFHSVPRKCLGRVVGENRHGLRLYFDNRNGDGAAEAAAALTVAADLPQAVSSETIIRRDAPARRVSPVGFRLNIWEFPALTDEAFSGRGCTKYN